MRHQRYEQIREQIQTVIGIYPTQHWWDSCIDAIVNEQDIPTTDNDDDISSAIVEQILYSDLRDIVRNGIDNQDTISNNSASQILRNAIRQSMNPEYNYKITLPESFRLLVQIEEYTDVAASYEQRMEMVSDDPNGPPQISGGNIAGRCFKFSYTDGYYQSNNDTTNNSIELNSPMMMVATEIIPLNGLGTQYPLVAGLKILLHGPIMIRHGIAGWTTGNVTILGGHVDQLVDIQRKALVQAKKEAGCGVDPTIKALIWNNNPNALDNEGDDEAEHESRDVVVETRNIPQQQPPPPQDYPQQLTTNRNNRIVQQQPPVLRPNPLQIHEAQRPLNIATTNSIQNEVTNNNHNSVTRISQTMSSTSMDSSQVIRGVVQPTRRQQQLNPYQRNDDSNSTPQPPSNQLNTNHLVDSDRPRPTNYPPAVSQIQRPTTESIVNNTTAPSFTPASALVPNTTRNAPTSSSETGVTVSGVTTSQSDSVQAPSNTTTDSKSTSAAAAKVVISFEQLRDLLQRCIESEIIYRHAFGQIYIVHNMNQYGTKLYFNIEKNKSSKKDDNATTTTKKTDKYEYIMTARFQEHGTDTGTITCKIASCILEPHFSLAPSEMRKLNKENRIQAEGLVKDGGQKLNTMLLQPGTFEVSLLVPPEDFFSSNNTTPRPNTIDGNTPILFLRNRL